MSRMSPSTSIRPSTKASPRRSSVGLIRYFAALAWRSFTSTSGESDNAAVLPSHKVIRSGSGRVLRISSAKRMTCFSSIGVLREGGDAECPVSGAGRHYNCVMSESVEIYTDGACKGNPGPGGWGALLKWGGHEKALCGGEMSTTNNRMELQAVIEALRALNRP